jgi:hypothetical protein
LRFVRYPLAVRSSSLLEDSQGQPFAGIYSTHMLSNNHPDLAVRLDQLCDAIKRVYASTFFQGAKRYLDATGRHVEEEKMGGHSPGDRRVAISAVVLPDVCRGGPLVQLLSHRGHDLGAG